MQFRTGHLDRPVQKRTLNAGAGRVGCVLMVRSWRNEYLMWKWLTGWGSITRQRATDDQAAIDQRTEVESGKYGVLYRYLEHRYADVVVLTFAEIEDLLGFALPQLARTYQAWWTVGANVKGAPHADAWTLAGRMASPNLQSRIVIFTRTSTVRPGLRSS
jgi:hypothetical protein